MTFRLTHLSMEHQGNLKGRDVPQAESLIHGAIKRWEKEIPHVIDNGWEKASPDMAADLLRFMAKDLQAEYGTMAVVKACQVMASHASERTPPGLEIQASWPQASAGLSSKVSFENPFESMGNEISGEGFSEKEISLAQLQESVANELKDLEPTPRFVLDPLVMVPNECLLKLAQDLDKAFPGNIFAILYSGAAVLLMWQAGEATHATDVTVRMDGLTRDGKAVQEGKEARVTSTITLMDPLPPTPQAEAKGPVAFSIKKPKLS